MIVATRDEFGFRRIVYAERGEATSNGIASLLRKARLPASVPDIAAIQGYLGGDRLAGHTVLRDVLAVPPGHSLIRSPQGWALRAAPGAAERGNLREALRASLQSALDSGKRVALALSGGLDSALLLALLREMGVQRSIPSYILVTDLPDYCERDTALDIADRLGARVKLVRVTAQDFVAALPAATRCVEEPMFNMHPVAKLLLARAMAADGIAVAITGDGADQVMRRDRSANYLPLCNAMFADAAVTLHAPFLDAAVVRHLTSLPRDPDKQCLRELGEQLALPERLVRGPKQGRLAPAMDLRPLVDDARIRDLSTTLGIAQPALHVDTERVLWTTLVLLLDSLQAEAMSHTSASAAATVSSSSAIESASSWHPRNPPS
ncbi:MULTISPECIES: asparagine synthase-related protein [unclassified Achromobacter]|uniref:asparagine synthase-related protein n=1 Tax=unclassified Achromobacter TaxID=2626865 RepID=UPI000B51A3F2|nr:MULTISPECIES: asparagine synthase-related protein [unclassified Achromobacter]OWT68138.1 asparagine synthase [Achromobacter sp. HZ34]OWT69975.1 asparagine synthase [Achromobacter sp. HZ28]